MKISIIGATGFVGRHMTAGLAAHGHEITPVVRAPAGLPGERVSGAMEAVIDWDNLLAGTDAVINLAARVHVMNDTVAVALSEYRRINCDVALAIARSAHRVGAKRYIFMSSIKVNGEHTEGRPPFTADEAQCPSDPYGRSKWEAEQGLRDLAASTGMEVVIIRPPLIYGPGVKANFRTMMEWLRRGVPIPLGAVQNSRSLVGVDNLVSLTRTCLEHPGAANQTFLISDGHDISTPQLLRILGEFLRTKARLVAIPVPMLIGISKILGKEDICKRLIYSLVLDISKTRDILEWRPQASLEDELQSTASSYLMGSKE